MEKTHHNHSREPATKGDIQAAVSELRSMMTDMMQELTATHDDVRSVRTTVTMLVTSDAAHEGAIESLRKRLERVERKVGIVK
jgi:predicted  nucleic acid-binding Zn-ribbon protein